MIEDRGRDSSGKRIYKQKEVDFIARLASKEYYVQVMDRVPQGQHGENEYGNLLLVPGSFRKIAIINSAFKAYTDNNGILIISLEEFLLNQDSLNL